MWERDGLNSSQAFDGVTSGTHTTRRTGDTFDHVKREKSKNAEEWATPKRWTKTEQTKDDDLGGGERGV